MLKNSYTHTCNRRERGEKEEETKERKMLTDKREESSPPTFIFSNTHRGPAFRLSPAYRNTALRGIAFTLPPFSS